MIGNHPPGRRGSDVALPFSEKAWAVPFVPMLL